MFGLTITTTDLTDRVVKAAEKAAFRNFAHGAATVRKEAIDEIKITKEIVGYITRKGRRVKVFRPSPVGTPVHSHRNKGFVRRGIKFDATKEDAVIGFASSVYGDVMRVHEFGGQREGVTFDARPTMFPALKKSAPRFAESWRGSINGE